MPFTHHLRVRYADGTRSDGFVPAAPLGASAALRRYVRTGEGQKIAKYL